MATSEPRTASELLDLVQINWAALEYAVASLSVAQLVAPGPDGWSIKDQLVHIGDWEQAVTAVLSGRPQFVGFGLDEATFASVNENLDGLNDLLFQRSRGLSVSEANAVRHRAHAEAIAALAALTDADLTRTIADFGADPTDHRPILPKIAGDTYAHYAEHTGWIQAQLAQEK